jgi:hypothetical protein
MRTPRRQNSVGLLRLGVGDERYRFFYFADTLAVFILVHGAHWFVLGIIN